MNKTPKINWNAGTEQIDNVRMPYISECVRYGNCVGVYMVVGRREDETVPQKFCYSLALDVDTTQQITISFQKRRQTLISLSANVAPDEYGEIVIHMPNIVALSNSAIPLNLFQAHIRKRHGRIRLYIDRRNTQRVQIPSYGIQREVFGAVYIINKYIP